MSSARPVAASRARAWLLGALALATIVAAYPPFSLWPLALVAAWPATAFVLDAPTPRAAALRGWLYGVGVLGLGTLWLAETLWLNLVLVALVGALWHAAWGWAARRVIPLAGPLPALPLLWTAQEMCRLNWPLSGYPWMLLGQALAGSEVLVQAADLGGVLLLTFLAATVAGGFMALRAGSRRGAVLAGLALGIAVVYGVVRPGTLPEPTPGPRLAAIQPNFPQELKDNPLSSDERYDRCLVLSRQALVADPPPDVLIWPETMWPYPLGEGSDDDVWFPAGNGYRAIGPREADHIWSPALAPLFGGRNELVLGTVWRRPDARGHILVSNRGVSYGRDGAVLGAHDKVLLVPGGESVPFGELLPERLKLAVEDWIEGAAGFVVDLAPGEGFWPVPVGGQPCGVTICFENAYGEASRESVARGAAFLLNLSNEAWFGTSSEHDQMELHSLLRAVETRRALVRSTNSGISCLVRPDGRRPQGADRLTVGGADRAVAGVFVAQVPLYEGLTPYVRWGDWPGWLGLAGALLLLLRHRPVRVP